MEWIADPKKGKPPATNHHGQFRIAVQGPIVSEVIVASNRDSPDLRHAHVISAPIVKSSSAGVSVS